MRSLLRLVLTVLVLGAVYIAVNRPGTLPFPVPWQARSPAPEPGAPAVDTPVEQDDTTLRPNPPGRVTDEAIKAFVARQPISLQALRKREYPGSPVKVKRSLPTGVNYTRQVVSYQSEGLTIYALLTVPTGPVPTGGWPAIVFNHGYIPPDEYRTTERYVAYQDAFARAGFVTLKSDYRGHGSSQGDALGGYNDPGYTVDVLNAAASLKKDPRVNPRRLGLWGHSMGGQLSLRALLVDPDLKAASLWAGVVAGYDVLATDWNRSPEVPAPVLDGLNRRYLRLLSPNSALKELRGRPIQLHHGTADKDVPYSFQQALARDLRAAGQPVEAYRYEGDDHNLSQNLGVALRRSVAFFRKHL